MCALSVFRSAQYTVGINVNLNVQQNVTAAYYFGSGII
jgi:hypothetical protein